MSKQKKVWAFSPRRSARQEVPDSIKADVEARANELVESVLKPQHVQPPPKDEHFNYIVDIYTKWHGSYFYFCAKYCSPGPNAISPFFEVKFARLEYVGNNRFNLSFMRHTEQWVELYADLPVTDCLTAIKDEPFFQP